MGYLSKFNDTVAEVLLENKNANPGDEKNEAESIHKKLHGHWLHNKTKWTPHLIKGPKGTLHSTVTFNDGSSSIIQSHGHADKLIGGFNENRKPEILKFNNTIGKITGLNEEWDNDTDYHRDMYWHHDKEAKKAKNKADNYGLNADLHKNNKNPSLNHETALKNLQQKYNEIANLHKEAQKWHYVEHNKLEKDSKYKL